MLPVGGGVLDVLLTVYVTVYLLPAKIFTSKGTFATFKDSNGGKSNAIVSATCSATTRGLSGSCNCARCSLKTGVVNGNGSRGVEFEF